MPFAKKTFRVATFNIDGGVGTDGRFDLGRTAADIHDFDLVALQEVHGGGMFDNRDQACVLGQMSQRDWLFAPAERRWWRDSFGCGVITDIPSDHWERLPISGVDATNYRSLLRLEMRIDSRTVHVLVVHLPTTNNRSMQASIIESLFLNLAEPVLLLGDLNTKPGDAWIESLRHHAGVVDAVGMFSEQQRPQHVDWILARGLACTEGGSVDRGSSDHPLYWGEFDLPSGNDGGVSGGPHHGPG